LIHEGTGRGPRKDTAASPPSGTSAAQESYYELPKAPCSLRTSRCLDGRGPINGFGILPILFSRRVVSALSRLRVEHKLDSQGPELLPGCLQPEPQTTPITFVSKSRRTIRQEGLIGRSYAFRYFRPPHRPSSSPESVFGTCPKQIRQGGRSFSELQVWRRQPPCSPLPTLQAGSCFDMRALLAKPSYGKGQAVPGPCCLPAFTSIACRATTRRGEASGCSSIRSLTRSLWRAHSMHAFLGLVIAGGIGPKSRHLRRCKHRPGHDCDKRFLDGLFWPCLGSGH